MNIIGLDLGSTTLSAVVVSHETGEVLAIRNIPGRANLKSDVPGGYLQDADTLAGKAMQLIEELSAGFGPIGAIGLDGQMHGILYIDQAGNAVSPFYTWQDGRGELPFEGETYAARLSRESGYPMATGFGMTTHYWHVKNRCVPRDAAAITTIYDYVAMKLTGRTAPLLHVSSAASLGLFDQAAGCWDKNALARAGLEDCLLPEVTDQPVILGHTPSGVPVGVTLGDNQASFIGSVREMDKSVLVNMGTGGQISMLAGSEDRLPDVEKRPLGQNRFLWVGSSLCGGKSYAMLKNFLESCMALAGTPCEISYDTMNRIGLAALDDSNSWSADTRFEGSRREPWLRGAFGGIGADNFDAPHLIGGILGGMAQELYDLYAKMLSAGAETPSVLIGSGNAIRKNPALIAAFERKFGLNLLIPARLEEAAYGAALFAMVCSGYQKTLGDAQKLIAYQSCR